MPRRRQPDSARLDALVAQTQRARTERAQGYREQALQRLPWVCGRCGRSFTRANVHELTVHHRDHNHDHNPPDGSNWELLCLYCHDDEHRRAVEARGTDADGTGSATGTHKGLAGLAELLGRKP
ncbi:YajD family HNH nuclease [Sediminicurvatus halobius]|uniref:Putative HNH nuclease YajD n=1 Tax=Sediminicurvatus halobius TaxID=2182432 RepID=A0A2U2N7P6_9GAMM|nr:YajD family HNH nuclease [Spiribacter halobius]PWG65215.1 HNH nuclease family protein [Spiribacter halobius]UEX78830.1 YajD family HNH nuclease [Spiribacter halobius]